MYTYDRSAMIRIGALKARKMLPTTVEGKTNPNTQRWELSIQKSDGF
jgi:hypothetical protein